MEAASQRPIELCGVKHGNLYCQSLFIQYWGYNSKYEITLKGSHDEPLKPVHFHELISVKYGTHDQLNHLHGNLKSIHHDIVDEEQWLWTITLGCSLHELDNHSNWRVFSNQSLDKIIETILSGHNIHYKIDFTQELPYVNYRAQAGISDYDFFLTLCVDYGLFFYYCFDSDGSQLFITDNIAQGSQHKLPFNPGNGLVEETSFISFVERNQTNLGDFIRLRGYPESDFNQIWETKTKNQTEIKGRGCVNIMLNESIDNPKILEKKAWLMQQQLDWQRETLKIEIQGRQLQPGDMIEIQYHPNPKINQLFQVFDVQSSINHESAKEPKHPLKQTAYILRPEFLFKSPCHETSSTKTSNSYCPQGRFPKIQKPTPSLQLGEIVGEQGQIVSIDEQGRYPVRPLFDQENPDSSKNHQLMRMAQPAASAPNKDSQGLHCVLPVGTRVVIAHLDNEINKPFILGALPDNEQLNPVNSHNNAMLMIKHRNGSALEFEEPLQNRQSARIYTKKHTHEFSMQADENNEIIHASSEEELKVQAKTDINMESQHHQIESERQIYQAGDEFSLVAKKQMEVNSGGDINFAVGHDWLLKAEQGRFNAQAKEKANLNADSLFIQSNSFNMETKDAHFHSGKELTINAEQTVAIQCGNSQALFNREQLGFKADTIKINAANIEKHQGGMANSGSDGIPNISLDKEKPLKAKLSKGEKTLKQNAVHSLEDLTKEHIKDTAIGDDEYQESLEQDFYSDNQELNYKKDFPWESTQQLGSCWINHNKTNLSLNVQASIPGSTIRNVMVSRLPGDELKIKVEKLLITDIFDNSNIRVDHEGNVSMTTNLLPKGSDYEYSYHYGIDPKSKLPQLGASISYKFEDYQLQTKYGQIKLNGTINFENLFIPDIKGLCIYAIALQRSAEKALPLIQTGLISAGLSMIAGPEVIPAVFAGTGVFSSIGAAYANPLKNTQMYKNKNSTLKVIFTTAPMEKS